MRHLHWLTAAILTFAVAAPASAQESNGSLIELRTVIDASPARVFEVLVKQVGEWWDPAHTYSGDPKNLSMDARPGGCFCETLPGGGGVEHLRIIYSAPGTMLRLSGALGPLQGSAIVGTMTINLVRQSEGTSVDLSYALSGSIPGGWDSITPAVKSVLDQQMQRLKLFMETGRPDGAALIPR